MALDNGLEFKLPTCPPGSEKFLQSPSTFFLYVGISVIALIGSVFTFVFHNHINLPFIRYKIKSFAISNTLWGAYFGAVSIRAIINAVRYGKPVKRDKDEVYLYVMTILAMLLHGITAICLTLALDYQRKYRDGSEEKNIIPSNLMQSIQGEEKQGFSDSTTDFDDAQQLIPNPASKKEKQSVGRKIVCCLFSIQMVSILLLVFFYLTTILRAINPGNAPLVYTYIQLTSIILQRLPILFVMILILIQKKGPKLITKIIGLFALILNLPNDIPLSFWYAWTHNWGQFGKCLIYIASSYDFIVLLYMFSLIVWFVFMRLEFKRNQESTMYTAYKQSQESFDFRKKPQFR